MPKTKLTQAQAIELLKVAGLDVEVVEENSDFDMDSLLSVVDDSRKPFIASGIDDSRRKEIEDATTGKLKGLIARELKKLTGYENKDAENWQEMVKEAVSHVQTGASADTAKLQQMIQEMATEKDRERDEAVRAEVEKYNTLNRRITDRDSIEALRSYLEPKTLEGDKGILASDLYRALNNDYHVQYDEANKTLQYFDKNDKAVPAKSGKQLFNIDEYTDNYFTVRGNMKKDMRGVDPKQEMNKRIPQQQQQQTPTTNKIGAELLAKFPAPQA